MLKFLKIFSFLLIGIATIAFLLIRKYRIEIEKMNYQEINSINSIEELSIYNIVRLASSKETLDSIFLNRDTTVSLFKYQINANYESPIIHLPYNKESDIGSDEIKRLKKLINGNNESYQIISELAAECGRMESTIGAEIQFILRRLNGEKIFCSSSILRHEYLNRLMFKLGIET